MALKLIVDTLEGIPEQQQALYAKTPEGKFKLEVDGLPEPEDTKGLKTALEKERTTRETLEKKMKDFEGVDPEEYRKFHQMVMSNKELSLIKDGKVDELKALWSENLTKEHQRVIKKLESDRDAAVKAALDKASKWTTKVLDNALRDAAEKAGVHSSAIEDVLFQGRAAFVVDDEGDAVLMRDGKVVVGKDGKSPMSPTEWLDQVRDKKPHWFPASGSGSGATQSSGSSARGRVMKRSAFDQLAPHEKRDTVKSGVQIVD